LVISLQENDRKSKFIYYPAAWPTLRPVPNSWAMRTFLLDFAKKHEIPKDDKEWRKLMKTRDEGLQKYKSPVTLKNIDRWKQRATELKSESTPRMIMIKWANIDRKLRPIERMVWEGIFQVESRMDL